jgi:tape measure domain-containing protein
VMTLDNKDFSIKTVQAGKVISDLKRSMEQTAASTKAIEDRFNSFGQKFRDITFNISVARFALQDINDILLALPKSVVGASAEIERMTKLLEGLSTQSDEAARKLEAAANVKFVFNMAKNAPFEVTALTDAFVKFKSAGLDPTNGSLQALVDSVARYGGSSEQLKRASVAIQQMAGKGVISMEELRQQLGEAVPNAMQLMADGMGVSMAELVKRISKGEVEARSALTQMTLMMEAVNGGAAQRMMDTWVGQIAQLKTNMTLLFSEIGNAGGEDGFFGEVKKQLKELNAYLGSGEMKAFARDMGYTLAEFAKGFMSVVRFITRFKDEIAIAGKAFLAYFAVSKINQFRASITQTFNTLRQSITDYVTESMAAERRKLAMESAARAQKLTAEAQAAQAELAILGEKHAAGLAMEEAYRAKWAMYDERAHTLKTAKARARNAQLASEQFALAMAQERANIQTANSIRALDGIVVSSYGKMTQESVALKKAFEGVSLASVMMGRAVSGLKAIFTALGGWVGITITLLTTAAAAWLTFGNDAEEGVKRANNAIRDGMATFEDYAAKQKEFQENSKEQMELEAKLATLRNKKTYVNGVQVDDLSVKIQIKEYEDRLKKLQQDSTQIWRDMGKAKTQAEAGANEEIIRGTERMIEIEMNKLQEGFNKEYAERVKAANKDKKLTDELTKWKGEAAAKLFEDQKKKVEELQKLNLDAQKRAKSPDELKVLQTEAKAYSNKLIEYAEKASQAKEVLGKGITTISMGGNKKPGGDSSMEGTLAPIDQLLHDLAAKREDLRAEIEGFAGDTAKLNYLLNNTLQYTGKKSGAPSQEEKDRALQAQVVVDKLKADKKALDDFQNIAERIKSSQGDIDTVVSDALDAFRVGDTEAPRHLTALNKTLADFKRSLEELAEGGGQAATMAREQLQNWGKVAGEMTAKANFAVLLREAADYAEKAKQIEAGLEDDDRLGKRNREMAELEHQRTLLQIRRDAAMASGEFDIQRLQEIERAMKEFEGYYSARMKQIARDSRTPMQQLADNWRNVTKQLEDATTSWANQTIDMLMNFVETGKLQFKELLESVLKDILRIQLQKQMATLLESVFGELTKVLGGVLGGKQTKAGENRAYDAQKDAMRVTLADEAADPTNSTDPQQSQKSFIDTLKEKLESMWKGVKDLFGRAWETISGLFSRLGDGLNGILGSLGSTLSGLMNSLSSGLGSIFSSIGSMGGGGGLIDAAGSFLGSVDWGSIGTDLLSFFGFAKGGIMTSGGPLDLKAYAKGGIANSPQLALFGEGSMNEAFVPLPDGRSIPVTMTGGVGGGAVVNVNVIEAPGTQAEVRESKGADGSTQIDVIIKQVEDKMAQNLSKGRGSLATTMERTYGLNRAAGAYR